MKCPRCGGEYRYGTRQVGIDSNGVPIYHRFAYCDNCRKKKDLDRVDWSRGYEKLRNSTLSICALICALLIAFAPIGGLLAIIDLTLCKNDGKKHNLSTVALVFSSFILIGSYVKVKNMSANNNSYRTATTRNASNKSATKDISVSGGNRNTTNSSSTTTKVETSDYTHMAVGEVAKKGNVYIGLSYVKRMDYLPLMSGKETDIGSGNEVILPFFEVYNDSADYSRIHFDDITCYADGVQAGSVESYIKVRCDGIPNYYWEDIGDHTKVITVQQFAVPKGWKELRFYYGSDIIWILSQDDVSTDKFKFNPIFSYYDIGRKETSIGSAIYDGDAQQIVFDGAKIYSRENRGTYVVFEFTVNNLSSTSLDYSLVGYKMSAYQGNYLLGDASFTLDSQIDGYTNVFNIDSIEPGMSAKIYVAFEKLFDWNDYYVIFDDGYGSHSYRGNAYIILEK